ncbi:hypothetical protein GOBAR_AA34788 [Gossypium barbadense]|uniref:Uncharacterized protein n=1 Tax=Gossypium barbadense TaxID=3634 RepID=A0A2P5W4B9_GOSBA|nr:hypothetical protein GOBAR_AA34788 [Gossypium barbadense]
MSSSRGKKIAVPASKKRKGAASSSEFTLELCSTFHLWTVMTNLDNLGTFQFGLGGLVRQLSVPEFVVTLGLYMEVFMDDNELDTLHCHIYYSPSNARGTSSLPQPPMILAAPRHRLSLYP